MGSVKLVESHAHLDDEAFKGDLQAVLDRARRNEVAAMVTVGTDAESSRRACEIAAAEPDLFVALGIHPHEADKVGDVEALRPLASRPKVVAVGETGLDYAKKYATPENQKRLFLAHLALARELGRPVVIHCRDAHRDAIDILKAERVSRGVIHCFSGTAADAREYLAMGFHLSIAGPVTYPNATALRETVRSIPLDRMMVETDCPLLTPQNHRGQRNEPAYVRYTAAQIAALHGVATDLVADRTAANAIQLFGLTL
jgi:TatD DNase family protein